MELATSLKLLISLAIGAAIGLEREIHQKKDHHKNRSGALLGVRTFSLTTLLGAIAGLLYQDHLILTTLFTASFILIVVSNYIVTAFVTKESGITTELAALLSFLIGALIALELFPMTVTLSLAIVLMLVLAYKDQVKNVVEDIHTREIKAILSYSIIAVIILPFLPNVGITVKQIPYIQQILSSFGHSLSSWGDLEIFNPFKTWLIVAIITGVDLVGYILERMFGKGKGLIVTSLVGGFVSSTATTQSLAVQSTETKHINHLVAAAMLATFASFFSLFIIILPLNPVFTVTIIPTLLILIISFGIASGTFLFLGRKQKHAELGEESAQSREIFSIKPALIFAGLYLSIKLLSNIALEFFGESGFLVTAGLAGLTGLDAMTINIAELSRQTIEMKTAVLAFLIVNAVNLLAKTFYIFLQGKREFVLKYGVTMMIIIVLSFAGLWFL
ncbi:MgtC/SapB family protein [Candidatus Roizmanbacteria bacterium]|nr:MAG: MgtC/SapB family protein [Candidatus Roizmanbacteria bacterium]